MMIPWGSLVNAAAVIFGSIIGLLVGKKYPESMRNNVMDAIGLVCIYLGISMSLKTTGPMIVFFSMILGGMIGHLLGFQRFLTNISVKIGKTHHSEYGNFSEGLLTAFLLFCIGSMSIVGAIEEGISGNTDLILTKSLLDGFTSIALASTFGSGVLFSFIPLLIFQGGISIAASFAGNSLSPDIIANLTGVGGLMVIGIGLRILKIKNINIIDFVPALILSVLFTLLF